MMIWNVVGILRQELRKLRQQDRVSGIFGGCDPNRTGWLRSKFPYRRKLDVDLLKARPHGLKQAFAGFRGRYASRGAGQQANSEPLFEFSDGVAQRRLRNA